MKQSIKVRSWSQNNDFVNVINDADGQQIGISESRNPITAKAVKASQGGHSVEMDVFEKNGRSFGSDIKAGGGFKGTPRNEKAIVAQSSLNYSVEFLKGKPDVKSEHIFALADKFYEYVDKKAGGL